MDGKRHNDCVGHAGPFATIEHAARAARSESAKLKSLF
jgi:hypothetical protein